MISPCLIYTNAIYWSVDRGLAYHLRFCINLHLIAISDNEHLKPYILPFQSLQSLVEIPRLSGYYEQPSHSGQSEEQTDPNLICLPSPSFSMLHTEKLGIGLFFFLGGGGGGGGGGG